MYQYNLIIAKIIAKDLDMAKGMLSTKQTKGFLDQVLISIRNMIKIA